jgi:restriction endonuclease Mrr
VVEAQRDALHIETTLALPDRETQRTVLNAIANSSATNLIQAAQTLQAFRNSTNIDELTAYLKRLQPDLEREPDTREILEHPETDLTTPETRERVMVSSPSIILLEKLRAAQISLHDLEWRQLEELVADLLSQEGYEVNLGPGSKDEGKDIIAVKRIPGAGFFMTVWQAKKLARHKKVGISVIRELADTRQEHKASKGIIVTTTTLTKGALARIERDCYLLHKVDGNDLDDWIRTGRQP